jgi:glucoamylase
MESVESFEQWLDHEYRYAATAMLRSISPTAIVKERPGFGQTVRPRAGSIIASPVLGAYDPDPDYFFHWYRDSAVVMDALRLLFEDGSVGAEAPAHLADFVRFSRSLQMLDGRARVASPSWHANVKPDFLKFVRDDAELARVHGDAVAAETRVNPDGTLDISKWARPQHDGPPLRALALLRWVDGASFDDDLSAELSALIRSDLEFTFRHWREPSFDIWEEEQGMHYYTLRVSAAALEEGAAWLHAKGDAAQAQAYCRDAAAIRAMLDGFWLADEGYYRSRALTSGTRSTKELDIAVILSAVHTDGGGAHSVEDPRMHATLARLEAFFDAAYPINHKRAADTAPAMGRYPGDVYYSGGAYFFSTLGAAEFCFRAAAAARDARAWAERGDAFLATVRMYTAPDGALSEQFDQRTGAQTSAKHLAWSYAAFISTLAARRAVAGKSGIQ